MSERLIFLQKVSDCSTPDGIQSLWDSSPLITAEDLLYAVNAVAWNRQTPRKVLISAVAVWQMVLGQETYGLGDAVRHAGEALALNGDVPSESLTVLAGCGSHPDLLPVVLLAVENRNANDAVYVAALASTGCDMSVVRRVAARRNVSGGLWEVCSRMVAAADDLELAVRNPRPKP